MSITVPDTETRLVRVEYEPEPRFLSETVAMLAPDPTGHQVLFVHLHLARQGIPAIKRVVDLDTGETIRVSGSWLGDGSFYD